MGDESVPEAVELRALHVSPFVPLIVHDRTFDTFQ
jgi:hypothetical protein